MQEFLSQLDEGIEVLLILSIILFAGFIMTRLTNTLNLPKVSGYIMAGILIGPCGLNFIPTGIIDHMSFVSDLALAFIAFGVGKFFKKEVLLRTGKRIIIITIFEAMMAGVLVTLATKLLFSLDWDFALILGAIATATAPASTMMTINQYKAKGEFVDTLLQIVALDDVVCLLAFSVVSALASGHAAGNVSAESIIMPIIYNLLALLLGFFCGYFLSRLLIPTRSRDNRLILAIAMLLGISGICAAADISPLLSCMVFGAAYINLTRDKKLYRQINNFTPPVMSIFFIVSGMNLDVKALSTVGAIGVVYFIVRIAGKYLGTYISCLITGTSRELRNYMGLALIPQAGVAIGLAFLGQRLLPPQTGNLMLTIILSSSVLYEMVGPISAKAALFLSGSIQIGGKDAGGAESGAEGQAAGKASVKPGMVEFLRDDGMPPEGQAEEYFAVEEEAAKEEGAPDGTDSREEGASPKTAHSFEEADSLDAEDGSERDGAPDGEYGSEEDGSPDEEDGSEEDSLSDEEECSEDADREEGQDGGLRGILEEINDITGGVEDLDYFDIEREIKPEKPVKQKKNGKSKKRHKKK